MRRRVLVVDGFDFIAPAVRRAGRVMSGRRRALVARASPVWAAVAVTGLLVDLAVYGARDPAAWVPDVAVGWAFLGCAVVASQRAPGNRVGLLLGLTGAAWFLGALHPFLVHLHRATLLHAVFSFPSGRLSGLARWVVPTVYGVSLVPWAWSDELSTVVLSGLVGLAVVRHVVLARGATRRARSYAALLATALLATTAGAALLRLAFPQGDADVPLLLAYSVVLAVVAVALAQGLLRAGWERVPVADLVVQLGDDRSGAVRDALARALGDPTLQVGYRRGEGFVDAGGRPVETAPVDVRRVVTPVRQAGRDVAVLVHDSSLLADAALSDALDTAARLVGENARLQDAVAQQVRELEDSRRRLVVAADRQRAALEAELRRGALQRLERLAGQLSAARRAATGAPARRIDDALAEVGRTRDELIALGRGLHPWQLEDQGLVPALRALAERCPVPLEVVVVGGPASPVEVPPEVAATAWFVCAEAITNAVKHARASRIDVHLDRSADQLHLSVADDGVGGAAGSSASGLLGLADRVEAVGGTLTVDSPSGHGTRVTAALPLELDGRPVADDVASADALPERAAPQHPHERVVGSDVDEPHAVGVLGPGAAEQRSPRG